MFPLAMGFFRPSDGFLFVFVLLWTAGILLSFSRELPTRIAGAILWIGGIVGVTIVVKQPGLLALVLAIGVGAGCGVVYAAIRNWSWRSALRGFGGTAPCPECGRVNSVGTRICPRCGHRQPDG